MVEPGAQQLLDPGLRRGDGYLGVSRFLQRCQTITFVIPAGGLAGIQVTPRAASGRSYSAHDRHPGRGLAGIQRKPRAASGLTPLLTF